MRVSKNFPNQTKRKTDSHVKPKKESQSTEGKNFQWLGLADLSNAHQAYRNKEYASALKSSGLGCLKLGVIAAACYGAYKWVSGDVVHINDFFTQAEKDFQTQGHQSFVPASVKSLIDSMYDEQKTFTRWPKSGIEFAAQHLEKDAPMSSSIIKYLFERSASNGDGTFEKYALKKCKEAATTSKSCLRVAEYLTGASHPEALSTAMRLVRIGLKTPTPFYEIIIENAKKLSIDQKSISDVVSLGTKLIKYNADLGKSIGFVENGAAMFDQEIGDMRKAIEDCKGMKAGDPAAGQVCYERASRWETAKAWALWISRKTDPWKKDYGAKQATILQNLLKEAIAGYVDYSKVCSKIPESKPCHRHVEQSVEMFRNHALALEKSVADCEKIKIPVTKDDEWNQCYSHASFFDQVELANHGWADWAKVRFAERRVKELKKEQQELLPGLGKILAESCLQFPSSIPCHYFSKEIIQKLIDSNLSGDAVKLMKGSKEEIAPLLNGLAQQNKWEQGIDLILRFAKKNPAVNIEKEVESFCKGVMNSNEAYRGFALLSVNDQLDIDKTLAKAFEHRDEDHLHGIYLLAKSWIAKKENKFDDPLKFIISELFKIAYPHGFHSWRTDTSSCSSWDVHTIEEQMARALATKWIQSIDSKGIEYSHLVDSWRLQNKPDSTWDRLSCHVTMANWETKLKDALSLRKT